MSNSALPGRRARASGHCRSTAPLPAAVPGTRRAARQAEAARSHPTARFKKAMFAAGVVAAGSGLAAAATLPGSGAQLTASPAQQLEHSAASAPLNAAVDAPAEASIDFSRHAAGAARSAQKSAEASAMSADIRPAGMQRSERAGQRLAGPLDQMIVASGFGYRANPLGGYGTSELHTGTDYSSACGTPVKAAGSGTVVEAGWHAYGGGQRIVVDHGGGLKTTYNHLSVIGVSVGQAVGQGDQVGAVGTTGNSTGCHLHFEVMVNDVKVDPLGWL